MTLNLGIKSDPIEYRYSFDWLFRLMKRNGITYLQLGTFFELYFVDDKYIQDLRNQAEVYDIRIKSCFTAHRELGGFFTGNKYFKEVALSSYKRLIDIAAILGVDYIGSNPGAIYRDNYDIKNEAIDCYIKNMKELMLYAYDKGIKALTIEPMSCLMEPPSVPEEIDYIMDNLYNFYKRKEGYAVPVYLCGDISHGYLDNNRNVIFSNEEIFEFGIPYMCEFHFKNTDQYYHKTFGFGKKDREKGIIDLYRIKDILYRNVKLWPVSCITGYLEINGPKLGRDYSDYKLEEELQDSIEHLKGVFTDSNEK